MSAGRSPAPALTSDARIGQLRLLGFLSALLLLHGLRLPWHLHHLPSLSSRGGGQDVVPFPGAIWAFTQDAYHRGRPASTVRCGYRRPDSQFKPAGAVCFGHLAACRTWRCVAQPLLPTTHRLDPAGNSQGSPASGWPALAGFAAIAISSAWRLSLCDAFKADLAVLAVATKAHLAQPPSLVVVYEVFPPSAAPLVNVARHVEIHTISPVLKARPGRC